jgi:hypothetical protein
MKEKGLPVAPCLPPKADHPGHWVAPYRLGVVLADRPAIQNPSLVVDRPPGKAQVGIQNLAQEPGQSAWQSADRDIWSQVLGCLDVHFLEPAQASAAWATKSITVLLTLWPARFCGAQDASRPSGPRAPHAAFCGADSASQSSKEVASMGAGLDPRGPKSGGGADGAGRGVLDTWQERVLFDFPCRAGAVLEELAKLRLHTHRRFAGHGLCQTTLIDPLGQRFHLRPKEAELVGFLFENPLTTRAQALQAVWGYGQAIETVTLETHLSAVRQVIEATSHPLHLSARDGGLILSGGLTLMGDGSQTLSVPY